MDFGSEEAYAVWTRLIQDESLYAAMMSDSLDELVKTQGYRITERERELLAKFRAERGVRWMMENLRFRSAMQTAETVSHRLPRTVRLLTKGDDDWLQDITFEYLAFFHWKVLGFNTIAEVERFGGYVTSRVMKRRFTPAYLKELLAFEMEIVRVYGRTASIPEAAWRPLPSQAPSAAQVAESRPCRTPQVSVVHSEVDLSEWIRSADPLKGKVVPGHTAALVWIPSPLVKHQMQLLSPGARLLFDACLGRSTGAELAKHFAEEYGAQPARVLELIGEWMVKGALIESIVSSPAPAIGLMSKHLSLGIPLLTTSARGNLQIQAIDHQGSLAKSGIGVADELLKLDGVQLRSAAAWQDALVNKEVGDRCVMTIHRVGAQLDIDVELLPARQELFETTDVDDPSGSPWSEAMKSLGERVPKLFTEA